MMPGRGPPADDLPKGARAPYGGHRMANDPLLAAAARGYVTAGGEAGVRLALSRPRGRHRRARATATRTWSGS